MCKGMTNRQRKIYQINPNIRKIVGVKRAVKIPLSVNPNPAYAPYFPLTSIAAEVPTACEAVPIDNPCAIGLFTCPIDNTLNPKIAPKIPTHTTTAAVSEGIPPTACVTSMAIGVVTDLEASDTMTSCVAPKSLATPTTETIPTRQPTNCDTMMGRSCFLMVSSCR